MENISASPEVIAEAAKEADIAFMCEHKDAVVRRLLQGQPVTIVASFVGRANPSFLTIVTEAAKRNTLICLHYGPDDPREWAWICKRSGEVPALKHIVQRVIDEDAVHNATTN